MASIPPEGKPPKLGSLSRQRLTITDLEQTLRGFERDSDRGVALVTAAMVDNKVKDAIVAKLPIGLKPDEYQRLFDGGQGLLAPLATFGARIEAAYAMAIYGPITRDDLRIIARIRNEFAHSEISVDFSHETIKAASLSLSAHKAYLREGLIEMKIIDTKEPSPKEIFQQTCFDILTVITREIGRQLNKKRRMYDRMLKGVASGRISENELTAYFWKAVGLRIP